MVIKRKVTLEFLGDEYKDSYLTFKSVSVSELGKLQAEAKKVSKAEDISSVNYVMDTLKEKFVEGEFLGEKVKVEELDDLDIETALTAFRRLTGQEMSENLGQPSRA